MFVQKNILKSDDLSQVAPPKIGKMCERDNQPNKDSTRFTIFPVGDVTM